MKVPTAKHAKVIDAQGLLAGRREPRSPCPPPASTSCAPYYVAQKRSISRWADKIAGRPRQQGVTPRSSDRGTCRFMPTCTAYDIILNPLASPLQHDTCRASVLEGLPRHTRPVPGWNDATPTKSGRHGLTTQIRGTEDQDPAPDQCARWVCSSPSPCVRRRTHWRRGGTRPASHRPIQQILTSLQPSRTARRDGEARPSDRKERKVILFVVFPRQRDRSPAIVYDQPITRRATCTSKAGPTLRGRHDPRPGSHRPDSMITQQPMPRLRKETQFGGQRFGEIGGVAMEALHERR